MDIRALYNKERVAKILDEIRTVLMTPLRQHEGSWVQDEYNRIWPLFGSLGKELVNGMLMGDAYMKQLYEKLLYSLLTGQQYTQADGTPAMKISPTFGAPEPIVAELKTYIEGYDGEGTARPASPNS